MSHNRLTTKLAAIIVAILWAALMIIPVGVGGGNILEENFCERGTVVENQPFKQTGGLLNWNCEYQAVPGHAAHKTSRFLLPTYAGLLAVYLVLIAPSFIIVFSVFRIGRKHTAPALSEAS